MWSDPDDIESWSPSVRGAGWLFGSKVTSQFNRINGLQLICRAHQLVQEGYNYMFPDKNLITVWSAPNYCYRCGNVASILMFNEYLDRQIAIFKEVPESGNQERAKMDLQYFYWHICALFQHLFVVRLVSLLNIPKSFHVMIHHFIIFFYLYFFYSFCFVFWPLFANYIHTHIHQELLIYYHYCHRAFHFVWFLDSMKFNFPCKLALIICRPCLMLPIQKWNIHCERRNNLVDKSLD